jgi:hypothetical protein
LRFKGDVMSKKLEPCLSVLEKKQMSRGQHCLEEPSGILEKEKNFEALMSHDVASERSALTDPTLLSEDQISHDLAHYDAFYFKNFHLASYENKKSFDEPLMVKDELSRESEQVNELSAYDEVQKNITSTPVDQVKQAFFSNHVHQQNDSGFTQHQDLNLLLKTCCQSLYIPETVTSTDSGHIVLDVNSSLPGTHIELIRDANMLKVILHVTHRDSLMVLYQKKEALKDVMQQSTSLHVIVELLDKC